MKDRCRCSRQSLLVLISLVYSVLFKSWLPWNSVSASNKFRSSSQQMYHLIPLSCCFCSCCSWWECKYLKRKDRYVKADPTHRSSRHSRDSLKERTGLQKMVQKMVKGVWWSRALVSYSFHGLSPSSDLAVADSPKEKRSWGPKLEAYILP